MGDNHTLERVAGMAATLDDLVPDDEPRSIDLDAAAVRFLRGWIAWVEDIPPRDLRESRDNAFCYECGPVRTRRPGSNYCKRHAHLENES